MSSSSGAGSPSSAEPEKQDKDKASADKDKAAGSAASSPEKKKDAATPGSDKDKKKSRSRSRKRDRDRDRDRDEKKKKDRDREKSRKDRSPSHKSKRSKKNRDSSRRRDRDRDRDRRDRDRDRDRDRSRRDRDRDRDRGRKHDRSRSRSRDRDRKKKKRRRDDSKDKDSVAADEEEFQRSKGVIPTATPSQPLTNGMGVPLGVPVAPQVPPVDTSRMTGAQLAKYQAELAAKQLGFSAAPIAGLAAGVVPLGGGLGAARDSRVADAARIAAERARIQMLQTQGMAGIGMGVVPKATPSFSVPGGPPLASKTPAPPPPVGGLTGSRKSSATSFNLSSISANLARERALMREKLEKAREDFNPDAEMANTEMNETGYLVVTDGDKLGVPPQYVVEGRAPLGNGAYAAVWRCKDSFNPSQRFAVKVSRNMHGMRQAAEKEIKLLQFMNEEAKKRGCTRIIDLIKVFDHGQFLCMSFPLMWKNLRGAEEFTKKDAGEGRPGFGLKTSHLCVQQIAEALHFLKQVDLIHCDLKPDNILIDQQLSHIKLCDFGASTFVKDAMITDELGPRYYRAPESVLGTPYDCSLDIWSFGCLAFELFTGQILFKGDCNNGMLQCWMSVVGHVPERMRKEGKYAATHFTETGDFLKKSKDIPTPTRPVVNTTSMQQLLEKYWHLPAEKGPNGDKERSQYRMKANMLAELITKCLVFEPRDRFTPDQILAHPFCKPLT